MQLHAQLLLFPRLLREGISVIILVQLVNTCIGIVLVRTSVIPLMFNKPLVVIFIVSIHVSLQLMLCIGTEAALLHAQAHISHQHSKERLFVIIHAQVLISCTGTPVARMIVIPH